MAIIKYKDIGKMGEAERAQKFKDLKLELIKSKVGANKTNSKTKEIKRAISRLLTFSKSNTNLLKAK